MNAIAHCAEAALHATPHPALRLSELLELVAERAHRSLTPEGLRAILEERPDRFRILDSWRGPWRTPDPGADDPTGLGRPHRDRDAADAWVVAVADPETPPDTPGPALRLRESVRWIGLGIDGRSRMEVSRWYAIAMAERETRRAVARRAA